MNTSVRGTPPLDTDRSPGLRTAPETSAHMVVAGLVGDVRDLEAEVRQLQQALLTRAPIEQAKGVLMLRYGLDAEAAFAILVRWSSVSNVKLREVAQAVIEVVGRGHGQADFDPSVLELVRDLADTTGAHVLGEGAGDATTREVTGGSQQG